MNNKNLFLLSKGVSHAGTRLFSFALSWYILSQTGSGLRFSVSLLVNYLPQIILPLFAGKLSDRTIRPNRILVLCDLTSAAVCCLPLVYLSLPSLYAVIFLLSAVSAVFNNIIDAHLIHLDGVDSAETLKKLTSSAQFITSSINMIAPSVGGVLIARISVRTFAVINIVSFLLSALGELRLKYRACQTERRAGNSGGNIRVLSGLFQNRKLRTFFIADSLGNFCFSAGVNVSLPLIAAATVSSGGYGLISSSVAAGSTLCAVWRTKVPGVYLLEYPFLKMGLLGCCMLALSLTARFPGSYPAAALCLIMFAVGWLSMDINIQTKTSFQLFADPECLGKILGISTSVSFVLIPLSLMTAGIVSELWPVFVLPLLSGLLLLLLLGLLWLAERREP